MLRLIHGAVNGGDEELAGTLVHPDFFSHAAPASRASGPAGFLATLRSLHEAFAGFRLEPQDVIAAEAKVVVRATASGRHAGPVDGPLPAGREWSAQQIHIFRIADGQVIEHWATDDLIDRRQ